MTITAEYVRPGKTNDSEESKTARDSAKEPYL